MLNIHNRIRVTPLELLHQLKDRFMVSTTKFLLMYLSVFEN